MNANMNVLEQCRIAASNGNQVLGMIRRNITYRCIKKIVLLYPCIKQYLCLTYNIVGRHGIHILGKT